MKRDAQTHRHRRRKAKLIAEYIERRPRELLEKRSREIEALLSYQTGVYALYKDGKLYYLGVARRRIVRRLLNHTRDRHKKHWNSFSLYTCRSLKQVMALETLFLRITRPAGNKITGRMRARDLIAELKKQLEVEKNLYRKVD
jgi:hypothetical protein